MLSHFVLFFKPNWNELIINDNDDKYNNNRHRSIEIINSVKTETTWDEYRSRVSKARK